jgi:site-specific recombinase XerD
MPNGMVCEVEDRMKIDEAIESYLEARRLAELGAGTLALYRRQLGAWVAWRVERGYAPGLADLAPDEILRYMAYLKDSHRPHGGRTAHRTGRLGVATLASVHRTLRAFWRWCGRHGHLSELQVQALALVDAPRVRRKPRTATDRATWRKLIDAAGDTRAGGRDGETAARDRALLYLLYESGARIAELCSLNDGQLDLKKRRAIIIGKGGKARPIFWQGGAAAALAEYLLLRRGRLGGDNPLFRGTSVRNPGGRLTTDAARAQIKRIAASCGVTLPYGAPLHAFRHAYARRAIANGADISDVSQLMGHANLATTMIYLEENEDRLAETYERIFGRSGDRHARHTDDESRDRKSGISDHG